MSTTTESFKQAEFALAAYSNLSPGISGQPYIDALEANGNGLSHDQATRFASTYSVAAQDADATGLSVTVFADAAGNRYLAIRGTEITLQDLLTDVIDIALLGTTALQPQYNSLKAKVQEWLGDGTLSQSFTVTGHSLGGFLATGTGPLSRRPWPRSAAASSRPNTTCHLPNR